MTAEEYQTEAERITPQLRQTALRYMGDASLSEDIAQDVLLRLWQLLDELRTPMDGLALTMVRNECLMRLRKQPRTVGMEGHDMAEQPSVNPMAELTLSMLDELPPLQQTILRLRHIDGMEIGEIATLLHKEEAAVRQNLSRGRKTLRLWIIKRMKEEEEMMNEKELNALIARYMEGETTCEEERRLEAYFQAHADVDEPLRPIRQLVLGLGALAEHQLAQTDPPAAKPKRSRLHIYVRRIAGVAASLLLIAGLALTLYRSQNYCEAIVYGEPVNDRELIMREVSGTMSQINKQSTVEHQLRDVLMTAE